MISKRLIITTLSAAVVILAAVYWIFIRGCSDPSTHELADDLPLLEGENPGKEVLYGIEYEGSQYDIQTGVIEPGQSLSTIFNRYGVSAVMVDRTAKAAQDVFDLRRIKAGNNYAAFMTTDSVPRMRYFVYEHNITDFIVIGFEGDSVAVSKQHKDVTMVRRTGTAEIESSLWNAMVAAGMPPALAVDIDERLYAWTIDFFGLQKGDHFTVIYDERQVEGEKAGYGQIWGCIFNHAGKDYYAIPFIQDGRIQYWDEKGNSLRKSMLKAPLKYSRISSKFSLSRMHPVLKIRRPHYGVDYAAPSGTPVQSVADGTVTFKGWDSKGGGNTLKIRHSKTLTTGYLHLKGFAKGIAVGSKVSQGQEIGYVGSTGTSTGPHLDYRVWRDGKPIDPLKITSEPAEPIREANRSDFEFVRDRIMAELAGELPDSLRINSLDSLPRPAPAPINAPAANGTAR